MDTSKSRRRTEIVWMRHHTTCVRRRITEGISDVWGLKLHFFLLLPACCCYCKIDPVVARRVLLRLAVVSALHRVHGCGSHAGLLFDISQCFPDLYQKGDFLEQSPSSITVVCLHNRNLIGQRRIRCCPIRWTFLNFSRRPQSRQNGRTHNAFREWPLHINDIRQRHM